MSHLVTKLLDLAKFAGYGSVPVSGGYGYKVPVLYNVIGSH